MTQDQQHAEGGRIPAARMYINEKAGDTQSDEREKYRKQYSRCNMAKKRQKKRTPTKLKVEFTA